jgi:outer membrane protein
LNKTYAVLPALLLGAAAVGAQAQPAPSKIGIIHVQNAILSTKDGQKSAAGLQTRFAPKKAELDKKQSAIAALQEQYRKGSASLSDEAKLKLTREIDAGTKALNRDTEDAQTELDQEQGKVMQELGQKMMTVLDKYAKDNGYAVVIDVSNPQTPVLWASNGVDITNDIVNLYDKANPGTAGSSAPAAAPAPSASKPAATTPAAPAARPAAPAAAPKKK